MPRLLLVDDNPSIHRIAESLLAPTDVELVCVDSAAEALDRIGRGERFDVALVDTAMPGMDGWALLARLRDMAETAHLPIALMAGVLDPVDPAKLAKAPIQGFLKKPIELRELGDRVKALLATPVAAPLEPAPFSPSPFSTVPATSTRDLARMVEPDLPEFRPEPAAAPVPEPLPAFERQPAFEPAMPDAPQAFEPAAAIPPPAAAEAEDDLLLLSAEDLWPEAERAAEPEPAGMPEVHLDLEELDLESLQGLTAETPVPAPAEAVQALPPASPVEPAEPMGLGDLGEFEALPEDLDLPPLPEPTVGPAHAEAGHPAPEAPAAPGWEAAVPAAGIAALAGLIAAPSGAPAWEAEAAALPSEPPVAPEPVEPPPAPAALGQAPAASGQGGAGTPADPAHAQALVQALLADPVLVDALVRAVVARMGDQVVREIAWEVMPDLAGRLQK